MPEKPPETERAGTGVSGLDDVLRGGLPRNRLYLLHGTAGTGKTTLGFQFLLEGLRRNEKALYITLLQDRDELADMAASHQWCLDGLDILEVSMEAARGDETGEQTVFNPADVELNEAVDAIIEGIERIQPQRLVLDSVSELAILADNSYRLRRHILRLKEKLSDQACTALFTAGDAEENLRPLKTVVHGVIELDARIPPYGQIRRRLEVTKVRAMNYSSGYHDFRIATGGIEVFPRLEIAETAEPCSWDPVSSGVSALDELFGGGLEKGTSCLITGTAGAGKSTLASLYIQAAAARGDPSVVFCFDERRETFIRRVATLGLDLTTYIDNGLVDVRQVDVGEMSPGEFVASVTRCVEDGSATIVVIDSLTGYMNALAHDGELIRQLHELLAYLGSHGVLSILILATQGLFASIQGSVEATYVADTVLLARHFEAEGQLRRCMSVLKKRHGNHEKSIREFDIAPRGIRVGPPLRHFSGILTGTPRFEGTRSDLLTRTVPGQMPPEDPS